MKKQVHGARLLLSVGTAVTLAIGMLAAGQTVYAAGPTPVGLGTAGSFAVLAGTGITNIGATTITGDVGSFSNPAETGFGTVVLNGTDHAGDAITQGAKSALGTAYNDAAGRTPSTVVAGGILAGKTLVGGVYNAGGFTLDLTGTLTLDGQNDPNSVWIIQAQSDLITASGSSVKLINGASSCNVIWQVTSSATLGSGSAFMGTILALTSITMANAVTMHGAALARNGNVTLIGDVITNACLTAPIALASPGASASSGASASPGASGASASPGTSASPASPGTSGQSTTPAPTSTASDGPTNNSAPLLPVMILLALAGSGLATVVVQRQRVRR